MIAISDVLSILDKIPIWKTLKELPGKVETLERKINELEDKLSKPQKPICEFCHEGGLVLEHRFHLPGIKPPQEEKTFKCQNPACGKIDRRRVLIAK